MIDISAILGPFLANVGAGLASNAIYAAIKRYLSSTPAPTKEGLEIAIRNVITAHGLTINASAVVDFLATNGVIAITNSSVYAPQRIIYAAADGDTFFGGSSRSATDATFIRSEGTGSGLHIQGNAAVRQNPDGSISFHTAPVRDSHSHLTDRPQKRVTHARMFVRKLDVFLYYSLPLLMQWRERGPVRPGHGCYPRRRKCTSTRSSQCR